MAETAAGTKPVRAQDYTRAGSKAPTHHRSTPDTSRGCAHTSDGTSDAPPIVVRLTGPFRCHADDTDVEVLVPTTVRWSATTSQ